MSKCGFLVVLLLFPSLDHTKLVRMKVADNISVLLPKGWRPMDDLDFTERYPSVRAPLAAYTSEDRLVDFSVNISATQWPDANLEIAQKFFKSSLYYMFDRIEMVKEGVHDVNGKKFIYFEFESVIKGNKRELGQQESIVNYTYIQYLVTTERTLVFSFSCPRRLRPEWEESARAIMKSIKIK